VTRSLLKTSSFLLREHEAFLSRPDGGWVRLTPVDTDFIVEKLGPFRRCVELGGGSGYVARLLVNAVTKQSFGVFFFFFFFFFFHFLSDAHRDSRSCRSTRRFLFRTAL
jgi:hypothetical protein